MKHNLLETILERLGRDQEASLGFDEIENWPFEEWNALQKTGIFRKAAASRVLECRGCEENCVMPVDVISSEDERPARAFICAPGRAHSLESASLLQTRSGELLAGRQGCPSRDGI